MYSWRGEWDPDVRYKSNDMVEHDGVGYLCMHDHTSSAADWPGGPSIAWEKLVDNSPGLELGSEQVDAFKDPFHYTESKGVGKPTYHICIDEGNDTALVVFGDLEEMLEARNLTNRLNNAVYRWMVQSNR